MPSTFLWIQSPRYTFSIPTVRRKVLIVYKRPKKVTNHNTRKRSWTAPEWPANTLRMSTSPYTVRLPNLNLDDFPLMNLLKATIYSSNQGYQFILSRDEPGHSNTNSRWSSEIQIISSPYHSPIRGQNKPLATYKIKKHCRNEWPARSVMLDPSSRKVSKPRQYTDRLLPSFVNDSTTTPRNNSVSPAPHCQPSYPRRHTSNHFTLPLTISPNLDHLPYKYRIASSSSS